MVSSVNERFGLFGVQTVRALKTVRSVRSVRAMLIVLTDRADCQFLNISVFTLWSPVWTAVRCSVNPAYANSPTKGTKFELEQDEFKFLSVFCLLKLMN